MDNRNDAFDKIIAYERNLHAKNQRRIKIGIRLLLVIPLIFLAIMFKMESNKVIFLGFWIASLFGIALYLISVEYMDYELQVKLREFGIRDEDEKINGLIDDNMDIDRIMRVANAFSESLSLEDKEADKPGVAQLEDKSIQEKEEIEEEIEEIEKTVPRPRPERKPEVEKKVSDRQDNIRRPSQTQRKKPRPTPPPPKKEATTAHSEAIKDVIDQIGVEAAEEELMASIKRYVAEVNKSDQPIVVEPRKSASDYAAMRKKRAQERLDNEEQ